MSSHGSIHEVEGEKVVAHLVATVQQDAVHASIKERLALPEPLLVNHKVEEGEEEEGKARSHKDKGDGPQILIEWHPAILLTGSA